MACRICVPLGIDPEDWLDSVSSRHLAMCDAYYRIEPFGAEMEHTATIASLLTGLTAMVAATCGEEAPIQNTEDFMPSVWEFGTRKKKKPATGKEVVSAGLNAVKAMVPTADERWYP